MAISQKENLECLEKFESDIQQEITILEEIYIDELQISHNASGFPELLTLSLHPATGDNLDERYVCMTLEIRLSLNYPCEPPEIAIRNPRGLADEHLSSLRSGLKHLTQDRLGEPILYDIIEYAKDGLTKSNVPHGECVVCLETFEVDDNTQTDFIRTDCYHYFHYACLLQYVEHSQKQIDCQVEEARLRNEQLTSVEQVGCPVCRVPLKYDMKMLQKTTEKIQTEQALKSEISNEWRNEEFLAQQQQRLQLYERQKQKGAIIDVEENQNKLLIKDTKTSVSPVMQTEQREMSPRLQEASSKNTETKHPEQNGLQKRLDHKERRANEKQRKQQKNERPSDDHYKIEQNRLHKNTKSRKKTDGESRSNVKTREQPQVKENTSDRTYYTASYHQGRFKENGYEDQRDGRGHDDHVQDGRRTHKRKDEYKSEMSNDAYRIERGHNEAKSEHRSERSYHSRESEHKLDGSCNEEHGYECSYSESECRHNRYECLHNNTKHRNGVDGNEGAYRPGSGRGHRGRGHRRQGQSDGMHGMRTIGRGADKLYDWEPQVDVDIQQKDAKGRRYKSHCDDASVPRPVRYHGKTGVEQDYQMKRSERDYGKQGSDRIKVAKDNPRDCGRFENECEDSLYSVDNKKNVSVRCSKGNEEGSSQGKTNGDGYQKMNGNSKYEDADKEKTVGKGVQHVFDTKYGDKKERLPNAKNADSCVQPKKIGIGRGRGTRSRNVPEAVRCPPGFEMGRTTGGTGKSRPPPGFGPR